MVCKECPYYGAIDIDKNDNLVWGCTRKICIEFTDDFAEQFGFETAQDYLQFKYSGFKF